MLRNRSYVKVAFSNVDVAAATDGEWESNGAQGYSEFDTIDYEYDYEETYATLELNRWGLDGSQIILISNTGNTRQDGFTSTLISNANGEFTTSAVLTREFTAPHTFAGLTFILIRVLKSGRLRLPQSFILIMKWSKIKQ